MPQAAPQDAANQPVFHIEKLYLKDLSFESPNSPEIFQTNLEPKVEFTLNTSAAKKGETHFEVVLKMEVKVGLEGKSLFLVDVSYAGLFMTRNIPAEHLPLLLNIECPGILFPYVRQIISEAVTNGGFKPLVLDPINFAMVYQQQQQALKQQAAEGKKGDKKAN